MSNKVLTCSMTLLMVVSLSAFRADARTSSESIVIGRLMGTLHKPPHTLLGNSPTVGGDRGSVEFRGFRLIREDSETFAIRPLRDGYFQQTLAPGRYSLVRQRRDRPSYTEDKTITILTFNVPENSLVNLGTLDIVLQGEPREIRYRPSRLQAKGTYIYRYRYERVSGEEAMSAPLEWFREKETAIFGQYADKIETIKVQPAEIIDSSRFTLRKSVFRLPLINE